MFYFSKTETNEKQRFQNCPSGVFMGARLEAGEAPERKLPDPMAGYSADRKDLVSAQVEYYKHVFKNGGFYSFPRPTADDAEAIAVYHVLEIVNTSRKFVMYTRRVAHT